jgi:hypothetical protein
MWPALKSAGVRTATVLFACLLAASLSGCAGQGDKAQTVEDCDSSQSYNAYEKRCVSQFEACRGWLRGQADAGEEKTSCQADSDGHALIDWGFGLTGTIHVTVKDGSGAVVYEDNLGNGNGHAALTGQRGAWTMAIDFGTATGSGEVVLWG